MRLERVMGTPTLGDVIQRRNPARDTCGHPRPAPRVSRVALLIVELFAALSAFAGGLGLLTGGLELPRKWLDGTPFDSYAIPGVVLVAMVGGGWLVAAWTVWSRHPLAPLASLAAGVVQLGWFAVQVALLGYISWMQPFYAALALFTLALAWRLRRYVAA